MLSRTLVAWRTSSRLCHLAQRGSFQVHSGPDHHLFQRRFLASSQAVLAPDYKYNKFNPISKRRPSLPRLEREEDETTRGRIRRNLFFRFFDYLGNYHLILQALVPLKKAGEILKLFTEGSKALFADMKEFAWVYKVLSKTSDWERACQTLSRKQLELYRALPGELLSVAPVLLVSALPMAQNVVFPLAMLYPKRLLSSHFWSPEIKREVARERQERRHKYYRNVFRDMQRILVNLRNRPYYMTFRGVLQKLVVGADHPSSEEILELKPLFSNECYFHLSVISSLHVRHLMRMHGLSDAFQWRARLQQHGNLLLQMDKAIRREGRERLSEEELESCCLIRGLNTEGVSADDMRKYLDDWLKVSLELDARSVSLLLHLPVFLGYNHKARFWDEESVQ